MKDPKLKIASFEKALLNFKALIKETPTEVERDACIQRFEYSFELAWTSLKSVLSNEGFTQEELASPKKVLKLAFQNHYIGSDLIWLEMHLLLTNLKHRQP